MFSSQIKVFLLFFLPICAYASGANVAGQQGDLLLALGIIFGVASLSWSVSKIGLPLVTGELGLGLLIGILAHYHVGFWVDIISSQTFAFLAQIGSILLLFEIGLESSISGLVSVGKHGTVTAIVGIIVPFVLGAWLIGSIVLGIADIKVNLFLGATLAATSTGISVRVFKDFGILRSSACQIVLSASIIDDILGLIILSVVSGLIAANSISFIAIGEILLNVLLFFAIALFIGRKVTPYIVKIFLKIRNDEAMIVTCLISLCLVWSWGAEELGLASIIGAFIAGLIFDEMIFRNTEQPHWFRKLTETDVLGVVNNNQQGIQSEIINHHHENRLIDLVKPLNHAFVPIFFVYAGTRVDIVAIANWHILLIGAGLSIVAILGKLASGIFLPKTVNRWLVGFGMVPRGEVGLIFALTGQQLGVFNQDIFAAVLFMVIITSLVTPLALQQIIRQTKIENKI